MLWLFLRQVGWLAVLGISLGIPLALADGRFMAAVFGVSPQDAVLIGSAAVMLLVSVAACLLPARRATKLDPLVALRAGGENQVIAQLLNSDRQLNRCRFVVVDEVALRRLPRPST